MQEKSDAQCLRAYVQGDESAFREIVSRHTDLVYSAALRQLNSQALAQDIAQSVFVDLVRRSGEVSHRMAQDASLAGWLYRSTRFAALKHLRDEHRRVEHERQAMEQLITDTSPTTDWERIRPILDEAMETLSDDDRDAVLLRYFKNHDFRAVGKALDLSDDAAQKRVSRAVERLREFFSKRGVAIGASGLVVVISANAVEAAPLTLAGMISSAVILAGTVHTSTAVTTTKAVAMTLFQKALITATVAIVAVAGIYQAHQATLLRAEVQTLQQQQAPLSAQIQQLQQERDDAASNLAAVQGGKQQSDRDTAELLKLRSQVTQLQSELTSRTTSDGSPPTPQTPTNPGNVHYKILDAPFKAAMRTRLNAMAGPLGLSDEQRQAAEGILTDINNKDPEGQFKALLSPEQQNAYHKFKREEATANVQNKLKSEAGQLQYALGLTYEQQNQVSAALHDIELNAALAKLEADPPGDPLTSWAQEAAREEKLAENKYNALTNILTSAQLENFRTLQADDLQLMKQTIEQGKKSLQQGTGQTNHE